MSGVESSDEWNERQAKNLKLDQCCRDNPLVALGKPRDILAILREGSDRKTYPQWWSICKQAADEIERLRAFKDAVEMASVQCAVNALPEIGRSNP